MSCVFCAEFNEGSARTIFLDDDWVLLATRGCFVPGYSLLMPVDHVRSFAALPESVLETVPRLLDRLSATINAEFGSPVLVAEHGPGPRHLGSACCDHAHLHIVPSTPEVVLTQYLRAGGPPTALSAFIDLTRYATVDYVLLSTRVGEYWVWPEAGLPAQFVRRICAAVAGRPTAWDWRVYPFEDEMLRTADRLRSRLAYASEAAL